MNIQLWLSSSICCSLLPSQTYIDIAHYSSHLLHTTATLIYSPSMVLALKNEEKRSTLSKSFQPKYLKINLHISVDHTESPYADIHLHNWREIIKFIFSYWRFPLTHKICNDNAFFQKHVINTQSMPIKLSWLYQFAAKYKT